MIKYKDYKWTGAIENELSKEPLPTVITFDQYHDILTPIYVKANHKLVELHKLKFGKQNECWQGSEYKFWIWQFDNYFVLVSNKKGICIELKISENETISSLASKAKFVMEDYQQRMV